MIDDGATRETESKTIPILLGRITVEFFPEGGYLVAGLSKKGEGVSGDEEAVIRGFFESPAISPQFVRRVLEEYGGDSVKAAFVLRGDLLAYWLDYLFRSRKGHYYRKRYPALSVV